LVEILENNLTKEEACLMEIELINKYGRDGYEEKGILINKSLGGELSAVGVKRIFTKEHKAKISKGVKGKKKHNKESIKPISDKNSKPVIQLDKQGNFIKEWPSEFYASKTLKINYHSINNCVMGISKSAGNYIWINKNKYKNKYENIT
jgi:hypothetical protein